MPTNSYLRKWFFPQLFFGSEVGLNKIIPFWGVAVFFLFCFKSFLQVYRKRVIKGEIMPGSTSQWDDSSWVEFFVCCYFGRQPDGSSTNRSRWFFIFTPIWGRFPFWLFRWVETTNQMIYCLFLFELDDEPNIYIKNGCFTISINEQMVVSGTRRGIWPKLGRIILQVMTYLGPNKNDLPEIRAKNKRGKVSWTCGKG